MPNSIAAIILTYNEERHIARCITSLQEVCQEIWVVDSFSTDRTVEIAQQLDAKTVTHRFQNHAKQFNWALAQCEIRSTWIWRVDADEYATKALAAKVRTTIQSCPLSVNGIFVNRKIIFMGRPLLHGGWYPAPQIKIIRKGFGASDNKIMDEHLVIHSGETLYINEDQTDENLNDLTWWTEKHNHYASREAINMLSLEHHSLMPSNGVKSKLFGSSPERKHWFKQRYAKLPLFVRPFLYFITRYFFQAGFLDGKAGFIWHILQGFWYRMLVDAKVYEIKKRFHFNDTAIKMWLQREYSS